MKLNKYLLLLIFFIVSINFSYSQTKKIYYNSGNLFGEGKMIDEKKEGDWIFYHANGIDILGKGAYKNGKEDGFWEIYAKNNKVFQRGNYINGKKDGKWLEGVLFDDFYYVKIYKNGKLLNTDKLKSIYLTGEKHSSVKLLNKKFNGEYKSYYKNGNLKKSGNYINDNKEGIFTSYYENGDTESIERYKNGELNGESMSFFEDGSLKSKIKYLNDLEHGYAIEYLEKDKLLFEGTLDKGDIIGKAVKYDYYDNGNIKFKKEFNGEYYDGEVINYYNNGNISSKENYSNDKRIGAYRTYYKDGTLKVSGEYSNDEKVGAWKKYFDNGKTKSLINYFYGKKSGKAYYYDISNYDHYLETKGSFSNNKKNGIWYNYDSKGNITSKITYENGYSTKKIHATKLYFQNSTGSTLSLILRYKDLKDEWVTKGWFNVKPGKKVYIRKVLDSKYLFYAENKKGTWKGKESRKFKGKYYSMKKKEIPESVMKYYGKSFTLNLRGS